MRDKTGSPFFRSIRPTVQIIGALLLVKLLARQIERLLAAGAHAYIAKPLDVLEFVRLIQGIAQAKGRSGR